MELKKQSFSQNIQKGKAYTQITLDDDCIVRDNKPDIIKIIHTKGNIYFEDIKVANQMVRLTGQMRFTVLYRSDSSGNKLETLSDVVNFSEKIYMDEVTELDHVKFSGKLEDLSITTINSRKLAVRAVVGIHVQCEQQMQEELVSSVIGDDSIRQKVETKQMLLPVTSQKDIVRTHNEFSLPGANPNIGRVIYYNVDIRNQHTECSGEQVQVQGEAYISVLYLSTEGQMEWYETMIPFTGSMDCASSGQQPVYWIQISPTEIQLELTGDTDGEMRSFSLDMTFDVNLKIWRESEIELLSDVYSLRENLIPQKQKMSTWKLMVKNEAKLRLSQQMKLSAEQERILQICSYEGSVDVDHVEQVENGLRVEGILSVHVLYATADDGMPIAHTLEQIEFTQVIDVKGLSQEERDVSYELEASIDQLAVNLLDNERFEVKAVLSLTALVLREVCCDKIVEIAEEPIDFAVLEKQPGVTGYIVQENETLWDIAKRCHTTEEEIAKTNELKTGDIRAGEKLIIVKSVG